MAKKFQYSLKVYYEDTDAGGIVYYANYLKYLERARTEMIYSLKLNHYLLEKKFGFQIVVVHCDVSFKKPALFEDNLTIESALAKLSSVKLEMNQKVFKAGHGIDTKKEELMVDATITLACVNKLGKPTKMPEEAFQLFRSCL